MILEGYFPENLSSVTVANEAALLARVTARMAQLLQGAPDELRQVLYRIDVPEHQVAEALTGPVPEQALAKAILGREQEKARSRAQHRNKPFNDSEKDLSW